MMKRVGSTFRQRRLLAPAQGAAAPWTCLRGMTEGSVLCPQTKTCTYCVSAHNRPDTRFTDAGKVRKLGRSHASIVVDSCVSRPSGWSPLGSSLFRQAVFALSPKVARYGFCQWLCLFIVSRTGCQRGSS